MAAVSTLVNRDRVALAVFIALWLGVGLFGRDPWKPDEAYSFGLVRHILQTGDWLVPTLAGEPFMEKPPLFFLSAAAFAQLFGGLLAAHEAARLACAFYAGLTLLFVWLAARELYGRPQALAAMLILASCIGYFHTAHLLVTDNALVAGIAIALYGLALARKKPALGGIALGTGTGIAFMAKGLIGPGMVALTALALLAAPAWRTRAYARSLAFAALAFAPWALIWPWALYRHSPELFREWLIVNNFGRYTGTADLGPERDHLMYLKILPLFALPALPLAACGAWRRWREPPIFLPLAASGAMLALLSSACSARYVYALPMLVPLSVLAGAAFERAPTWLHRGLLWLGLSLGAAAALILWLGWLALLVHWPAPVAQTLLGFRPDFVPAIDILPTALAVAATLGALFAIQRIASAALAVPFAWALGTTLAWTLFFTLWLGYQDYGNSYRDTITDMKAHFPEGANCIAQRDLGEPQRAMLEYFGGIVAHPVTSPRAAGCELLLVQQQGYAAPLPPHDPQWIALWSGTRPGDVTERFWLFGSAERVQNAERQNRALIAAKR